jgi:hypothetical protein
VSQATALMQRIGAPVLEFRFRQDPAGDDLPSPEWQGRPDLYVTFRKAIAADDETNMKAIPRKQRAMVRKGIEAGLRSVVGDDVDRLHRIYAESVRNLGTPVFHRRYFHLLREVFRDHLDVLTTISCTGR